MARGGKSKRVKEVKAEEREGCQKRGDVDEDKVGGGVKTEGRRSCKWVRAKGGT